MAYRDFFWVMTQINCWRSSELIHRNKLNDHFNTSWYKSMFYEDTNVTRVIGWCSWHEEALTQASSQRKNWAGPPDSPPSQTQVWSRGGLDSGSSLPLACKSATMSQKRASRLKGWGPKESPGQKKMSMTQIWECLKKKKRFVMAGQGYELCNNVMQLYQIITSICSNTWFV